MSTHSDSEECWFCGGEMHTCMDTKPPTFDYICYDCGHFSTTKHDRMTLDELNEDRKYCMELPALKERAKTYEEKGAEL